MTKCRNCDRLCWLWAYDSTTLRYRFGYTCVCGHHDWWWAK